MADEFDIVDDDEQTIVLDEEEMEGGGDFDLEDDAGAIDDGGDDFLDEEEVDLAPPKYRPGNNVYSVMLVLSFIAYVVALTLILQEMEPYCDPHKFMFGMFK